MEQENITLAIREKLLQDDKDLKDAFKNEQDSIETFINKLPEAEKTTVKNVSNKYNKKMENNTDENTKKTNTVSLKTNTKTKKNTDVILKYDENFKNIVNLMIDNLDLKVLTNRELDLFQNKQELIRNYCRSKDIIKTFSRVDEIPEYRFGKKEYFITAISSISNLNICNSFGDIIKQNRENSIFKKLLVETTSGNVNVEKKCVCGQNNYLINMYIMENKKTGLHLLIGSDCIEKWGLATVQQLKKVDKHFKTIKNKWIDIVKKSVIMNNFYYRRRLYNSLKWNSLILLQVDIDDWNRKVGIIVEKEEEIKPKEKKHNVIIMPKEIENENDFEYNDDEPDKVFLFVLFEEKNILKPYGIKWDDEVKRWYISRGKMNNHLRRYELVYLNVSYKDSNKAKEIGAKWDGNVKKWYCSREKAEKIKLI